MKKNNTFLMLIDNCLQKGKTTEKFAVYLSLSLLFVISATYFYWVGNGIFFYQENRLLFIFSIEYLQKFAIKPGGLVEYAGNFLTQYYYSDGAGTLIISSFLILLCYIFIKINRRLSPDRSISLMFILLPSCLILLLQKRYDHLMHFNLGYLLVAMWFLLSIAIPEKLFRLIVLALFPLFFYLVGSFAFLYLGMFIIYFLIYEQGVLRYLFTVFLIVIVVLTFIVFKELLFLQPIDHLLRYPLPIVDLKSFPKFLYLLLGCFMLFPLLIKIFDPVKLKKKFAEIIPYATILTIFPVTVILLSKHNDPDTANLFKIEKAIYIQDWDAIINQHQSSPSTNVIGQYYYNLALSEKDQLCEKLFFGRQDFGSKSLTLQRDNELINRAIYFYYAIGLISEAHHLAFESMVNYGYRPENIKLLIKTELINGNYRIAEQYINVLKKTLHYRNWAIKYEKMIINHQLINTDPELAGKIRLLPGNDFFIRPNDAQNIELVLMASPYNKRAFEYKMSRFLLERDIVSVVNEVRKMKEMGYTNIPRHIEEAVVTFINIYKELPDLGGLDINPETKSRFFQYSSFCNLYSGNKSRLQKEMKKSERNTFWYYYQFK
jgi:hypothetical protein